MSLFLFRFTLLSSEFSLPSDDPGDPEAPERPSGVAANVPPRLPARGSGGAPTAGCRLSAIMRPREPKAWPAGPDAATGGGGGTTADLSNRDECPSITVRCSASVSCGAGAIMALRAISSRPMRRFEAFSTKGGGATMAGCGALTSTVPLVTPNSGGGATTEARNVECRRRSAS